MPLLTYLADRIADTLTDTNANGVGDNVVHVVQKCGCGNDQPLEMTTMRLGDLIAEPQDEQHYGLRDFVADYMEGTVVMKPVATLIRPKKNCANNQPTLNQPTFVPQFRQPMQYPTHEHDDQQYQANRNDNSHVFNISLPEINVNVAGLPQHAIATNTDYFPPQPNTQFVTVEKEIPVYVEQNVPVVYDRKVPIITEQNVPVVYDRKVPIITEQNVPVVYDRTVPVITEQNVPVVYERTGEGIISRMSNAVKTRFNTNKQNAMRLNDAIAEIG